MSSTLQIRAPLPVLADALTVTSLETPIPADGPRVASLDVAPASHDPGAPRAGRPETDTPLDHAGATVVGVEAAAGDVQRRPILSLPVRSLLVMLWLAVAALLVSRVVAGQYRAARTLRRRRSSTDPEVLRDVRQLSAAAKFPSGVRLSVADELSTPIAWGMREVVLPTRALTSLSAGELRAAIAHEVAHLRGRDPLWRLGTAFIAAVFFFQPLTRFAQRRLEDASEALADDWAVRAAGSPIPLARCLASVAEWITPKRPATLAALVPIAADPTRLDRRIRRVLESSVSDAADPKGLRTSAAVGLLALLTVLGPRVGTAVDQVDLAVPTTESQVRPDTVITHPDPSESLASRWSWALREGARERIGDVWIAYRVRSVVEGQWIQGSFGSTRGRPLREVFSDRAAGSSEAYALLRVKPHRDGSGTLERVSSQSTEVGGFDFGDRRVFWLGPADPAQGVALLRELFRSDNPRVREQLVELIAIHDASGVQEFLQQVLAGRDVEGVRAEAAESLEFYPSSQTIEILTAAAFEDRASRVRSEAAEALGDIGTPAVRGALLRIANSAPEDAAVEAAEALASVPGAETVQELERLAYDASRTSVQREAIEAIADHPGEPAVSVLERIAREHPSDRMSREATEKLLERDPAAARAILDPSQGERSVSARMEAVESVSEGPASDNIALLEDVAFSDPDRAVQRQAAEQLAEFGNPAVDALLRLAFDHPSADVAAQAAESLGQLSGAEALEALTRIIDDHEDEKIVRQAVESLGELGTDSARMVLERVFREHRFRSARLEAGDQLVGDFESGAAD